MKYNSQTVKGHDYSRPLSEMLPAIIGYKKRAKTVMQIAKAAGRQRQSVDRVISRLHKRGEAHVAGWKRGASGPYVELWKLGKGKDAPKPAPLTNTEKSNRYRATEKGKAAYARAKKKWRRSGKAKEYYRQYNVARWARVKFSTGGVAAIDPLLAAIMGSSNART